MTRTVDYSALHDPVTKQEVAAFRAGLRGDAANTSTIINAVILIVGTIVGGIVMVVIAGGSLVSFAIDAGTRVITPASVIVGLVPIVLVIILVVGLLLAIRYWLISTWEQRMRLHRFAEANGLKYTEVSANPDYPGQIFSIGDSRRVTNHVRSVAGRFFDIGNYQYSTGSGKNRSTSHWGFMAFNLDRRLPHMVLDSASNNSFFGMSNLPTTLARNQVLSLEGDFDQYFTLYCPREYERDALYVFTPDLMALLIDEAAPFDVEIVDDWMFVYSSGAFEPTDPAHYERLFRIIDTVGAKTLSQSDRYVDEKVGSFSANYVAPQGQRLRRGIPLVGVVALIVFAVFWVGPWAFGVLNL